MTELKPCPFCGHDARLMAQTTYEGIEGGSMWNALVFCTGCSICTPLIFEQKEEAIKKVTEIWNRRASE